MVTENTASQREEAPAHPHARLEQRAMEQMQQREIDKPLHDQAAQWAASWNKREARRVTDIMDRAGIKYPTCPVCGRKLRANVRHVVIPPNAGPHKFGDTVADDYGHSFRFIGAIRFSIPFSGHPAGSIIAHCPDGTFGRTDHRPFCTAACAIVFGRKAHKAGYR